MSKVTIMIGIPASGKSTIAKTLPGIYVCPDEVRKELYGDISIQGNPKEVFAIVEDRIRSAIANGSDVVYDATNTTKYRVKTIEEFRTYGATEINGVFVLTPLSVCKTRNGNRKDRSEPVPEEVLEKMWASLKENPPTEEDGFDKLTVITNC